MTPFLENLLISLCTALVATTAAFQALPPTTPLDTRTVVGIIAAGVSAFAGAVINGLRQKVKDPEA